MKQEMGQVSHERRLPQLALKQEKQLNQACLVSPDLETRKKSDHAMTQPVWPNVGVPRNNNANGARITGTHRASKQKGKTG